MSTMIRSAPQVRTSLGALVGALIALWPGSLPRDVTTAATLTAACVAMMTGLAGIFGPAPGDNEIRRRVVTAVSTSTLAVMVTLNMLWQNAIRDDLGVARVNAGYGLTLVVAAVAAFVALAWFRRGSALIALACTLVAGLLAAPAPSTAATSGDIGREASILTENWIRTGGLHKRAVVIAVPTGSGWVDPQATAAMRAQFDGDVAILALPYAFSSSWRVFVAHRESAGASAIAVASRVLAALDKLPPATPRPKLYLYGQSLGALGADRARVWIQTHHHTALAGTILAGLPADTVGADRSASPRIVIANSSDPITRWSPASIWRPPTQPPETRWVGRATHMPPWIPLASFVQASVDLLAALDGAAGSGHRYGPEQGRLRRLSAQPIGPRAAS